MRACLLLIAVMIPAASLGAEYRLDWARTYDSSTHSHDAALDVAGTPSGETIVIGYERRADLAAGHNILVKKFDSAGGLLWSDSYDSGSDSDDRGIGVAVEPGGAVLAAGYVADGVTTSAGWVRKYDAEGVEQWTATFNKSGSAQAIFEGVAVNPNTREIYLAGSSRVGTNYWDGLLAKYSAGGTLQWSVTYNGLAGENDKFLDVTVDGSGNVLVTGYYANNKAPGSSTHNYNILVGKYDQFGNLLWQKTYGGETSPTDYYKDYGQGIATDAENSIYVAGTLRVNDKSGDPNAGRWIRKYNPEGSQVLWTAIYKRGDDDDFGLDLALGGDGAVYVAGWSHTPAVYEGKNLTVDRLSCLSGQILQLVDYHAVRATYDTSGLDEMGFGIAAWSDSRFVVVGSEDREDIGQGLNWIVLSYAFPPALEASRDNIRAYPNPFRPSLAVGGTLKFANLPAGATVRIYSIAGRLVREMPEQGNSVAWDGRDGDGEEMPTGPYYYVVLIPNEREVRGKFALIDQ